MNQRLRRVLAGAFLLGALMAAGCGPGGGPGAVPAALINPIPPPPVPLAGIMVVNPGIPGGAPAPPGGGALVFDEPALLGIWTGAYDPDNPLGDQPPPAGFIP